MALVRPVSKYARTSARRRKAWHARRLRNRPAGSSDRSSYGKLLEDSIKLALDDFAVADGIPGVSGGANRPLVLVGCNDGVNEDQTDVVAKHLVDDLGVPAIIGHAFSGNTLKVAQDVTIPGKVLLVSPSATSSLITALESTDNGLVWRTAPSERLQAPALASYYTQVRAAAVAKYPATGSRSIKVAIVNHSDAYGSGIASALEASLRFNGMSASSQAGTCYLRVDYGSSAAPNLSDVSTLVSFAADIIYLLGFSEGPDKIFTAVENGWKSAVPSDGHYPFWVFSDGGEVASLWASTAAPARPADITSFDQRTRVSGTAPGVSATSWPPYGTFLSAFSASSYAVDGSADTLGPAGAYDSLYLLAYSTVMVGTNPLTGANLVKYGLSKMQKTSGLPTVQIGRSNIASAFPKLGTGSPINVTGASGPLPFDAKGDINSADIQIWCVPPSTAPSTDVGGAATHSGVYFSGTAGSMVGPVNASCAGTVSAP
jgi:branched-chain amino acid transport system substrate-binding protein